MTTAHVPQPAFELADGTPVSAGFGDVYFSREGGVAETEHVFLRGNGLPERWVSALGAHKETLYQASPHQPCQARPHLIPPPLGEDGFVRLL